MIGFRVDVTAITNNSYATASLIELKLIQRKEGARQKEMALGWIVMLERNKKMLRSASFEKVSINPSWKISLKDRQSELLLKILFVLEAKSCFSSNSQLFLIWLVQYFNFAQVPLSSPF